MKLSTGFTIALLVLSAFTVLALPVSALHQKTFSASASWSGTASRTGNDILTVTSTVRGTMTLKIAETFGSIIVQVNTASCNGVKCSAGFSSNVQSGDTIKVSITETGISRCPAFSVSDSLGTSFSGGFVACVKN